MTHRITRVEVFDEQGQRMGYVRRVRLGRFWVWRVLAKAGEMPGSSLGKEDTLREAVEAMMEGIERGN